MQYLFIRIVKARGLSNNASPYVKIRTSNHSVRSKPASYRPGEPSNSPEWNQVFALGHSRPDSGAGTLEISVWEGPPEQFLGGVCFNVSDVPVRDPPDSYLAPSWYHLEGTVDNQHSGRVTGDIQLSLWIGTQADYAFPESRSSDAPNVKFEKFVPYSGWTEDSDCYHLIVDLPGFRSEEVKLVIDENSSHIRVSGKRVMMSENKFSHFQETYRLPENSSSDKISGKFEGEILHVIVPKKKEAANGNKEATNENKTSNGIKEAEEENYELQKPSKNEKEKDSNKEKYELQSSGHGSHGEKEEKMSETGGQREGFQEESREVRGQDKQGSVLGEFNRKVEQEQRDCYDCCVGVFIRDVSIS